MSEATNMIEVFKNEKFGDVRTLTEGETVLFCASDIAKDLGYSRPNDAVSAHCRYTVKRRIPHPQSPEKQIEMSFIPESDIYRLIAHSKLPAAQEFEHWVFDEVLPMIRKTGGYVADEDLFVETYLPFSDDNTKMLFKLTLETVQQLNGIIRKQAKQLEDERPLVEFADHVSNASNLIDIGTLAKIANDENIDIGRTRLFDWLRSNGYLMDSASNKNQPYQKYIEQGLFKVREYTYKTPYGEKVATKAMVTGKGQIYFVEKLRKAFAAKIDSNETADVVMEPKEVSA